jgi:hypothetical protein
VRADILPDRLTHYYRDVPFHTLSDLDDAAVARTLEQAAQSRDLEFRLTRDEYLPRRREIEAEMRRQLIALGGAPARSSPHYAILGTFSLYEDDAAWRSVSASLDEIDPSALTFTFTDSYFNFSDTNLRGVPIPRRPYHKHVYRLEDLPALVEQFGLPGDRWRTEPESIFDVYIEAQIWDDAALAAFWPPRA